MPELQIARDRRRELDELVVEERHSDLEGVRHRRSVEVVQHVVREGELGVEEQDGSYGWPAYESRGTDNRAEPDGMLSTGDY